MGKEYYIGVMSGTSMDGVDVALVAIDDTKIDLVDHYAYPMPEQLKERLLHVCIGQQTDLVEIGKLDHEFGHLFADAVLTLLEHSGYRNKQIRAIGNHGQTVYHHPYGEQRFTMQLGDANIIAARTGIDTIADFRRKDMALGGQGAPLVLAFHQALFQSEDSTVVILNIGGIANISVMQPGLPLLGYDTGPGNMLMDAWCQLQTGQAYDRDAVFALQGDVNEELLVHLLREPYIALPAPKSTGRELFNLTWLQRHLDEWTLSEQDIQRTLCEYSAVTIAQQVSRYRHGPNPTLLICGGGAKNPLLMARLQTLLPEWTLNDTNSLGVNSDYMEAMAFAWLACRRIHGLPSSIPEVTGASKAASLGVLYFAEEESYDQ